MEHLDIEGLFWLPEKNDDKIPGRLTFHPKDGAELDLIGAFHDIQEFMNVTDPPMRVHGVAGGKYITLDRCLVTNSQIQWPGIAREKYRVGVILSGALIAENEGLEFSIVRCRLRHLNQWIGRTGTKVDMHRDDRKGVFSRVDITNIPLDDIVVSTDIGELLLKFSYSLKGDPLVNIGIEQGCDFELRPQIPMSLEKMVSVCNALKDLVTIGVGTASSIEKITLARPTFKESIDVYAPFIGSSDMSTKTPHPREMLFTFDDIGGITAMGRWANLFGKYDIVINTLLSHTYSEQIYADIRFFNSITAAEALARIHSGRQNLKLDYELEAMTAHAGSVFESLVGDVEQWIKEVVKTRTNNVIHRGLHEGETPRLFLLAESLYFLIVISLLRECHIPETVLSNISSHSRFRWLAKQLREAKDIG